MTKFVKIDLRTNGEFHPYVIDVHKIESVRASTLPGDDVMVLTMQSGATYRFREDDWSKLAPGEGTGIDLVQELHSGWEEPDISESALETVEIEIDDGVELKAIAHPTVEEPIESIRDRLGTGGPGYFKHGPEGEEQYTKTMVAAAEKMFRNQAKEKSTTEICEDALQRIGAAGEGIRSNTITHVDWLNEELKRANPPRFGTQQYVKDES